MENKITTDLIPINTTATALFQENGLDPILNEIKKKVDEFESDVTKAEGRKEIKSFAYKIAQSKTFIDTAGKELVAKQKAALKLIDTERKRSRDFLDEQKTIVRQPLTNYEDAEKEKERVKQYNTDWDTALSEDNIFNREREIIRKETEAIRIEYEERLKTGAAEQATRQAKEAVQQAEREKIAAIERAKIQQELAEQDKQDAIEAEKQKARDQAVQLERERIREQERVKLETERKASNKAHTHKIKDAALADLITNGFDEDIAKEFIRTVAEGKISNISINY